MNTKIRFLILGLALVSNVWAKTFVVVENKTSLTLHLETALEKSSLERDYWGQLAYEVAPGKTVRILKFNRDSGIKNKKTYLFGTKVRVDGDSVKLLQMVRGKFINSHLWQSLGVPDRKLVWSDNRDPKTMGVMLGGKPVRITYRAVPDKTDDNVHYEFSELPFLEIGGEEKKLTLLDYNIYMRPSGVFKNGQNIRARLLPEVIKGNDVVVFAEAFDNSARKILFEGIKHDYPFRTKVIGEDRGPFQDGGVAIASKWPILEEDEYLFGKLCHMMFEDCLSDKGIAYAKVLKGTMPYHIFATHLQAGYTAKDKKVRRDQLRKLREFVEQKNIPAFEAVIMTGDFNINYMELEEKEAGFDLLEVHDEAMLSDLQKHQGLSNNYAVMLEILKARGLEHVGHRFSFDPTTNKLAKTSEPPELVEHILVSKTHKAPTYATQQVLQVKTELPWKEFSWEPALYDLSDHYPVRAEFEF